jgi:hypothetical protein
MGSSHTSGPPGQPPPHPVRRPSERQALLEAGAVTFGYVITEAVGDTVTFLGCEGCGRAPATLRAFAGAWPVDAFLDCHVWCSACGRDTAHVVRITPRPWSTP